MTKEQAKQQLETFFSRLGQKTSLLEEQNFVKARLGEAIVGFEFHDGKQALEARALVYRFRKEPRENVLSAIESAEVTNETGGGTAVFDPEDLTIYLKHDFTEPVADNLFYDQVNELAFASLRWSNEVLGQIAEKASATQP